MGTMLRFLLPMPVLRPLLKPLTRFLIGALAIPLFRIFLRRVVRLHEFDRELEKDLEQWFRASLLLLAATANMEHLLFEWVPLDLADRHSWLAVAMRILLAIGVIESMPDQALFSVAHPAPASLKPHRRERYFGLAAQIGPYLKGLFFQHLGRSSPVFAIMAAIFGGNPAAGDQLDHVVVGWCCYGLAISQYLVIGLVTSSEKAIEALSRRDAAVVRSSGSAHASVSAIAPAPMPAAA